MYDVKLQKKARDANFTASRGCRFIYGLFRLRIPLACYHVEVGASDGADVGENVVPEVSVFESLVARYVEHLERVVVA